MTPSLPRSWLASLDLAVIAVVAVMAALAVGAPGCAGTVTARAADTHRSSDASPEPEPAAARPAPVLIELIDAGYADEVELEARLALAMALNDEAEWRASMEHLRVLVENWSGLWTVQLEYGRALYRLGGDAQKVRAALESSIALRPVNPRAYLTLGQLLEDQGELAQAEAHYRKAVEQRDLDGSASFALARVLRSQGRAEDAIEVLLDVIGREGSQVRLLVQLAGAEEDAGRLDDAESTWRRVAMLHADPLKGHTMLYRFLRRAGREAAAAEVAATIAQLKAERTEERNLRPLRPSIE